MFWLALLALIIHFYPNVRLLSGFGPHDEALSRTFKLWPPSTGQSWQRRHNAVTILNVSLEQRQTWPCARLARWHGPVRTHWCTICHLSTDGHGGHRVQTRSIYKEMLSLWIRSPLDKCVRTSSGPAQAGAQADRCHDVMSQQSFIMSTNLGWKLTFLLLLKSKQIANYLKPLKTFDLILIITHPSWSTTKYSNSLAVSRVANYLHDKWGWGLSAANLSDSPEGRNGRDFGCGGSASLYVWPCYWTVCPDELCGMSSHQRWSCHPWWRARHNASETLLRN